MRRSTIAEKHRFDISWQDVPNISQYTVDGGAGGAELLAWYQTHRVPFWVYLSYDNFATYGYEDANYARLANYTDFYFMYITSFNYSIEKRGADNFDMWNVSITLEEV
jgi:hypothetical protein